MKKSLKKNFNHFIYKLSVNTKVTENFKDELQQLPQPFLNFDFYFVLFFATILSIINITEQDISNKVKVNIISSITNYHMCLGPLLIIWY